MKNYEHKQTGTFLLGTYSVMIAVMALLFVLGRLRRSSLPGLLLLTGALAIFSKLTITVDREKIELQFGLGFVRKRFWLQDIVTCQVVKNPWYYGLGVRYTPRGWLYAVSGKTAVELQQKNGKTVRIGTDDAEGLCQALRIALRS